MKSLSSYSSRIPISLKISWHSERLDHRTDNLRTFLCNLFFHPCYFQGLFACYLNVLFLCLFAVQAHNGSALLAQNLIALQGALEVEFKF